VILAHRRRIFGLALYIKGTLTPHLRTDAGRCLPALLPARTHRPSL
jgi:hypothetical protein